MFMSNSRPVVSTIMALWKEYIYKNGKLIGEVIKITDDKKERQND